MNTTDQITKEMLDLTFAEGVTIEQTRSIRASGDTYVTENIEGINEKDIKKKNNDGTFEVYENTLHTVTFRMDLNGDTLSNQIKYAFSELVIKAQAKTRPQIALVGDEEFSDMLKKNGGVLTFRTVTDFEPQSRAATTTEKIAAGIGKTENMDELEQLERVLAEQKKRILASHKAGVK